MEKQEPPIRIICPGRVYRNEAISYRAHCFFHQVEALYVDKNVSFADLKQALLFFAKEMFSPDTKIRLRPFNNRRSYRICATVRSFHVGATIDALLLSFWYLVGQCDRLLFNRLLLEYSGSL